MTIDFDGRVFHWAGPAPHFFVSVPEAQCEELRAASRFVTYGWGMIPVHVRIGAAEWRTSLFPKDGRYLVPLRLSVRRAEGIEEGDEVSVHLDLRT
ncbi:DUF1905 domain-containing protein [Deinococcus pimensis]|uniref:DUF1905 domain-containing protein n=1 Tax=Deinococcus pimensis TaxID=309888 RepID=UPI00048704FD|nr:DUF1905 domain-containing protein [Deinococcus pimensis]